MSSLYYAARQGLLTGGLVWTGQRVFATLLSAVYEPYFDHDATVADVPSAAILSGSVELTGLTAAAGYAGAGNVVFGAITLPVAVQAILLTLQPGAAQALTDPLFAYLDQGVGFGQVPKALVPTSISWDVRGIFRP